MYDVAIIGARCAGSPLAMLLARQGHRVLVVDRATFPSDALSTHFIWPRGLTYLAEWGILDEATARTPRNAKMELRFEDITVVGEVPKEHTTKRFRSLHGRDPRDVQSDYASVRRKVLDHALVEAADQAGAEVRTGVRIDELIFDDGRVVGFRGRDGNGARFEERARIVVGADGRHSLLAKQLELPKLDVHMQCTFAYWSYFEGMDIEHAHLAKRGRLGVGAVPTTDGAAMVLAFGPRTWWNGFRSDRATNHRKVVEQVAPDLAERLAGATQVDKAYGTIEMEAFWRRGAGPGWMLVGDAGCVKDQCTASGITHAFRDAALAAERIHEGLTDGDLDGAGERYRRDRYLDGVDYYRFVCLQAEMHPARPEELASLTSTAASPEETGKLLAAYGDSLPVRAVSSRRHMARMLAKADPVDRDTYLAHTGRAAQAQFSPFEERQVEAPLLSGSSAAFARPTARNLLDRVDAYDRFVAERLETGLYPYVRSYEQMPTVEAEQRDGLERASAGVNYASQDYLSLCVHPEVRQAGIDALKKWGPHSAGSPFVVGNTTESKLLEQELAAFLHKEAAMLFPTGWAAGFGSVSFLARPGDVIILDEYSHNCLFNGARNTGARLERYRHIDEDALAWTLQKVRRASPSAGVLVVTEGIFSMDADQPDLKRCLALCREHDATLLVDVAHDLGATGENGLGELEIQGVLDEPDVLVMGSFSKTFASNGGFLAGSKALKRYAQQFSSSWVFSNALSPAQIATIRTSLRVVQSDEGKELRRRAREASIALREELEARGVQLLGTPGPIVPAFLGEEGVARQVFRALLRHGVVTNMLELPVVPSGMARLRLQVMALHTREHAVRCADGVLKAIMEVDPSILRRDVREQRASK